MLRRLGIRGKLLAALAVPVLVLFAAATLVSWQSVGTARVARSVSELVGTSDELSGFARAMQTERLVSLAYVANPVAAAGRLIAARTGTDEASVRLVDAVEAITVTPLGDRVAQSLEQTRKVRAGLPALRKEIDATRLTRAVVDTRYSTMIEVHVEQAGVFADALTDRDLASYLAAYGRVGEAEESLVHELPAAMVVIRAGGSNPRAVLDLASTVTLDTAKYNSARDAVSALRLPTQLSILDAGYFSQRLQLSSGEAAAVRTVDPGTFEKRSLDALKEIASVSDFVSGKGAALAASKQAAAVRETTITVGVTLLTLLLSVAIAMLIARQIVVPLRRLTLAADDVRTQLPSLVEQVAVPGAVPQLSLVQIPVTSRDEIGRLATAFNEVNAATIQVAQEQAALRGSIAEMFVNVARRDQVLLNRQISFIDALERSEEDPGTLANLFRLDHLATRMRRNAESLLVLAGIDSGRRVRDSMPLSDVIRTASSEIELYDRVELELGADPNMRGFSALAAAHLLAELLENATMFSEPETVVEVETSAAGEYLQIVVHDHGIGMSDAELASVNDRIRLTAASDVLGAQRLGFYVVGRLAARLGAKVVLRRGQDGSGTDAIVLFPLSVFERDDAATPQLSGAEPAAAGSAPREADAPEAVPVDLAGMTDGATGVGLPRRRARSDVGGQRAADAVALTGEHQIVLPVRPDVSLPLELSAVRGDWAPAVLAGGSATILPSRATPGGPDRVVEPQALAATAPAAPAAPTVPAPTPAPAARSGLFAGFRGRVADAPPVTSSLPPGRRTRGEKLPIDAVASDSIPTPRVPPAEEIAAIPEFVIPELMPDDEPWVPEARFEPLAVPRHAPSHRATSPAPPAAVAPAPPRVASDAPRPSLVPPVFESSLNEARAWGVDEQVAPVVTSWEPEPDVDRRGVPGAGASDAGASDAGAPAPRPVDASAATAEPRSDLSPLVRPVAPAPALVQAADPEVDPRLVPGFGPAPAEVACAPTADTSTRPHLKPVRSQRRGFFGWLRGRLAAETPTPVVPVAAPVAPVAAPAVPTPAVLPAPSAVGSGSDGTPAARRLVVPLVPLWAPPRPLTGPVASAVEPMPNHDASVPARAVELPGRRTGGDDAPGWLPSPARPDAPAARAASLGVLDEQVAAMLALRSDIQEQALAEFSQLSAYRPKVVGTNGNGGSSLQRRVPAVIPAAPAIVLAPSERVDARNPDELRSRLSNFQSGTSRGRRESVASDDAAVAPDGPAADISSPTLSDVHQEEE